ncbi:hypothetical protein KP509_03G056600 [Ceratopteris richardii]|nr:hypothetical protein KP509_03G056600 [Ceratopteris richardii]
MLSPFFIQPVCRIRRPDAVVLKGPHAAFGDAPSPEGSGSVEKGWRTTSKLVKVPRKLLRPFSKMRTLLSTSTGEPSA